MDTTLITAFTLRYKTYCLLVFIHHLQESFGPITLYGSINLLPSFHFHNKVVYVTVVELAYVIIG